MIDGKRVRGALRTAGTCSCSSGVARVCSSANTLGALRSTAGAFLWGSLKCERVRRRCMSAAAPRLLPVLLAHSQPPYSALCLVKLLRCLTAENISKIHCNGRENPSETPACKLCPIAAAEVEYLLPNFQAKSFGSRFARGALFCVSKAFCFGAKDALFECELNTLTSGFVLVAI